MHGLVWLAAAPLFLAVLGPARAQPASGPLDEVFPPGEPLCYARRYDAAHLRANPRQSVASVRLLRDFPSLRLDADWNRRYQARDGRTAYATLIVTYRDSGVRRFVGGPSCTVREGGEIHCSAGSCDGGGFTLVREDADTILIGRKGGNQRFTVSGGCAGGPDRSLNRGAGDDVFRLKRAPIRDCR
jgi:hypothetical protein